MQRHPELWWLVAVAVVVSGGVTVATTVSGTFRSDSSLPATSPDALVASVLNRDSAGYSGTISTQVQLGLPARLQSALVAAVPAAGTVLNGGVHTVQYWYGGPDKQRLAMRSLGREQDVFRNGSRVLTWDTESRESYTTTMTATPVIALSAATPLNLTPPGLADLLLDQTRDDSDTSLRSGDTIAGRPTYELVLRPRSETSRVGEVQIQVDGKQFVPLGVTIFPRDTATPAVDVSFTSIRFSAPAERNFTFVPPAGTASAQGAGEPGSLVAAVADARVRGTGWNAISTLESNARTAATVRKFLGASLAPVAGRWGKGSQMCTPLVCLLVTTKGAVLAGAVSPTALYEAVD